MISFQRNRETNQGSINKQFIDQSVRVHSIALPYSLVLPKHQIPWQSHIQA
jgi:hypothetical protein